MEWLIGGWLVTRTASLKTQLGQPGLEDLFKVFMNMCVYRCHCIAILLASEL